MFPPELITFAVTMIIRALVDKWAQASDNARAKEEARGEMVRADHKAASDIRERMGILFGVTTSILAIFAFAVIIGFRIIAPAFTDVTVYFAYTETGGLKIPFLFESIEKMKFMAFPGVTFLPSDSHTLAAITGAIFGRVRR
jgi:hypothetical protein